MGELDAPDVSSTLQAAVQALRDRPVLFKYCIEEVATARHNALFQRFIAALTRGGPGGMPRPMELHAHDPQRYINDMLAWVHQALADEKEFVTALFGADKSNAGELDEQQHAYAGEHTITVP
jgi:conserved oligomeric Golgi complex subunit 6